MSLAWNPSTRSTLFSFSITIVEDNIHYLLIIERKIVFVIDQYLTNTYIPYTYNYLNNYALINYVKMPLSSLHVNVISNLVRIGNQIRVNACRALYQINNLVSVNIYGIAVPIPGN